MIQLTLKRKAKHAKLRLITFSFGNQASSADGQQTPPARPVISFLK
jgi:hypothetical protein